jgi:hypothetical protein
VVASDTNANVNKNLLGAIGLNNGIDVNVIVLALVIAAILGISYLFFYKRLIPKKADHEKN